MSLCKKDLGKKSEQNDKHTAIPTSVAASISFSIYIKAHGRLVGVLHSQPQPQEG